MEGLKTSSAVAGGGVKGILIKSFDPVSSSDHGAQAARRKNVAMPWVSDANLYKLQQWCLPHPHVLSNLRRLSKVREFEPSFHGDIGQEGDGPHHQRSRMHVHAGERRGHAPHQDLLAHLEAPRRDLS